MTNLDSPADESPSSPAIPARPPGGEAPLSFAQQRMWFINQYDTEGDVQNNVAYAIELTGPLAVDALRAAFQEITRRHPSLRTRFGQRGGVPHQIVDPFTEIPIPLTDVERGSLTERIDGHARHLFDLEQGAPWKADLFRLGAAEHVLLINMHHIVCDGSSFRILFRELSALYNATVHGQPCAFPALAVQYTDYAWWQRQRIEEGHLDGDLAFWKERLGGAPDLLALPTDRPRPVTASHSGGAVPFRVSKELHTRLQELRRRERTTLFKTLLTAFQVLMWRYSQQTDVVVGTPARTRKQPELENVMGFFINVLPLRAQIDPNERFSALLARVTESVVEAQEHQEIPFDYLVNELSPQRSLGHSPIVQVMFALQREALSALQLEGIVTRRLEQKAAARFDVALSAYERADDIVGTCDYRTDLFERSTIERMLAHFTRLLEAIVENPDQRVSRYELLSDAERRQMLVDWNRVQAPYPQDLTMHGLVEAQVQQNPDAIALAFEDRSLTYREWDARANQLARYLIDRGVGPEVRVGLCVERSLEMMIGILGILKAGGAYVPLDPSYPKSRLEHLVQDARMPCVVTQSHLRDRLGDDIPRVDLDEAHAEIASCSEEAPTVPLLSRNLAYVIYTSGSTGKPKGVMITHRSVVHLAYSQRKRLEGLPGTRVLQFASLSFDTSVWEFLMAWGRAAALVLGTKESLLPGVDLSALMNEQGVDIATLPPAALAALDPSTLPTLKVLVSAGEALSLAQITPWLAGRTVINGYGPTESTVGAAIGEVSPDEPINIGHPFPNVELYILDRALQPVPVGVGGELFISGAGLARGYLGRPELTAEKFLPNPFGQAGSRMYRTGDLVRYRSDGKIEFLGRTDHQVKIRGFRIELGEIEATLERHPAIAQVLVMARGESEAKRLIAYFTPKSKGEAPTTAELRRFVKETLPEHMVPSFFVSLDAFPLTPNDKIDRAALPAPDLSAAENREYIAPRTPIEETLTGIWQQVLRVPRVGVRDNFFEIGGHSLLATQAISRINDAFSLALPVRVLFEAPDAESFARRLADAQATGQIARVPLVPIARGDALPLSSAQQRLWFLSKLEGPGYTYNISAVLRLRGALDQEALVRALESIVERHEVLRTRFRETDGVPTQVIDPAAGFVVQRRRLTMPQRRRLTMPQTLEDIIDEQAHFPFDLSRDALFRALLIEEGTGAHTVVLTMHHIIADGWSFAVLTRELVELYTAFHEGRSSPLPPLVIQYTDFAHWQREWMAGELLATETKYWTAALADLPPLLELPTDRPRPPVQSYRGAHERFLVPGELAAQLRALSQRSGATLFMTLLAAFDVLLSRYSGQTDIAVGTPVANRTRPELESLIGFFINNLVLRADLRGDPTFTTLLRQVRETALNAYAHQDVPFEHLVEQLNPARSLSHTPLFQVMLVLQNAPFSALRLPELEVTQIPHEQRGTKFDLTLSLTETEAGLAGNLEYSTDLFDRSTIERLLAHYTRLLEAIVENPDQRVSRYELLSDDERRQMLVDWNRVQAPYPQDQTMHGLVEAQVRENPDAIALVFEDQSLTYREWDARANQLARYLIDRGVGPEVRVGLCVERSLEMMIGILGILKAGGAYVPLDPSYPKSRLEHLVQDARMPCVVTQSHLRDRLGDDIPRVDLDEAHAEIASYSDEAPNVPLLSRNLAYVIYTSGSTGKPKGVMITHRSVVHLAYSQRKRLEGLPGKRVLQFASLSFDTSVWEFLMAWGRGATLVLGSKERLLPGVDLSALMNEQGVDIATLPPAALAALDPATLPELKVLVSAGEALSLAQITPWMPGRTVINGYGPTESTVGAAIGEVSPDEPINIGHPFPNVELYILDRALQPVPVGVGGELFISGAGLARGYLGRPELTAEKFLPNPFGEAGSRMYRTGDLVRYRSDGKIEFLGRTDHQVKIRGFRIELGEIESTLERHPAIAQALVMARGEGDVKRLVAYFTLKAKGEAPTTAELRRFVKETLPEHMVPSFFVSLDAFPLTPNDKIDRAALPAPDLAAAAAREYTAPRTPTEQTLAEIWQQVLHLPQVGVQDHFFEIGGHSLLATQAISRINDAFSLALPVRVLFELPDVEGLARHIDEAQTTGAVTRLPLTPIPRSGPLPLSSAQQRLWFLSELEGPSYTYNIPAALRLRGPLDQDALVRALEAVVARHEVLRTRFREDGGVPTQRIDPVGGFVVQRQRVSTPDSLQSLIDAELHHPFDLSRDPLFRALLIEVAPPPAPVGIAADTDAEEHVLALTIHHSVADGWSMGILMSELETLYSAFHEGRPSPLPPLAIQYADFAHWQREWMAGELLAAETDFWKTALADLPPLLELPTDRPRPPMQSYRGAHERFAFPKELAERLNALSQRSGATLFMTLLAAFDVLLSRYSGQTDIAVGTPVAGRTRPELESLIGFFINNLVLRADLAGDPTFTALLAQVRETSLNAYAHQDIPFEHLVEQLKPARSLSHAPLFQVMLALQNAPFSGLRLPGLAVSPIPHEQRGTKFDLTLSLTETDTGLAGLLEYSTDLFDRSTIERMLAHYTRLLEAIVEKPDQRVSRYELLSDDERRQMLVDWNRVQAPYPQDQTMHGLVEAQVRENPDAIALAFEAQNLTYREWDARANQLARYLIDRGVGPEVRVGLCVERSLEMMIGILGILKAGGAYVPLDPSYPKSRLEHLVQDARMPCVVTQSHLRDRLGDDVPCVDLDEAHAEIASYSKEAPNVPLLSRNLAYVIYTSGSTGKPKGVMITHRSVVHLAYSQRKRLEGLPGTRVLQFASLSFDTSVWEFLMAWGRGATLVLGSKERLLPGADLSTLMNEQGVDIATLPPAALAALDPSTLPTLKVLVSAGEALSLAQITPWMPGRTVINGYGPTESTVGAAIGEVSPDEPINIGHPFPNVELYILDRALQPVPVGVGGELFISGAGLARGYLGRPELTAEKFLPNPFSQAGSRMYRTGDLVRYRSDGKIEFLGRTDHQVKIRGFRIELGEIESTLERHPAIAQVLVMARGEGDVKRLVAYFTLKAKGEEPTTAELRRFVKETLPEHMVPSFFVSLDAFPLTPNDKIDRAALPAPDLAAAAAREYTAPRTSTELTLAEIWQQVLHLPQVGVQDHFFEIGGHSLLATQAISRINDAFSLALPVRVLFELPDVEGLARHIDEAQTTGAVTRLPLTPIPRSGPLPLSSAQQRLWFLSKLEGPSYTYNVPAVIRLRGLLDERALLGALEGVVERHEVLRTRFREADGVPQQVVGPAGDFVVRRRRLASPKALPAVLDEELHYPFDLGRDALFRVLLIEEEPDDHVLVLNLHHSISDGWSMGVLMSELSTLYAALREARTASLPPLAIQYADFAHWQREWLAGGALAVQTEYWKEALANLPPLLDLPTDRPRPPMQSYRGAHEPLRLSKELTDQLNALSRRSGATLFMTLLAAFDVLLSRYSGQTDIAVGTPVANRTRPELEPLIGFFINTLVLRADLGGDPAFSTLLRQVRETALNAYAHQDIPFEYLVEQLNPERSLSYSPLFQAALLLQNAPFSALRFPELEVTPVSQEQRATKVDLTLSLMETDGALAGAVEYSTDLFDRSTIKRMLAHYTRLLEAIVENPDQRVSRYELLGEAEREEILVRWNRVQAPYPQDQTMHGLVEAQVQQNPDAVALVFEDQSLTYREWDARANQLARYLIDRGVGPEVRVGLCVERSLEMMVGILGILKAGGAYVPLDPSYPKSRLEHLVQDARMPCVVTQSHLRDRLGDDIPRVDLDEAHAEIASYSDEAPNVPLLSRNLAYVIYTSGSTGKPKGVMITHRSVVHLAYSQRKRLEGLPGTRVLQFASLSFDTSVWEFLMAWGRGATLVLGSKERLLPGVDLSALMNEQGVDIATLPPAALAALDPTTLPELKVLVSAGEALSLAQITPWMPGRTVINGYGPTESTVGAAIGEVSPDEPINIGHPFPNVELYILDRALQPVPVGVGGELFISGAGLARGYLGRPELTAEKFLPNPFGEAGSRMYRTGDLVRYRSDGKIEFLGRTDHQVKIRGFRIELGEIESTLERHPAIAQVLVMARGEGDVKRLVAYFTLKAKGEAPSTAELRRFLKETLPEHMVPSFFVSLDAFPLTPNDKIDRAALPAPAAAGIADEYTAPRTAIEHTLVRIWQQVLHIPRVGIHDHFFEIGGHSLLVVRVATRIEQALNVKIPVLELYRHPTVAALATYVTRSANEERSRAADAPASPLVVLSARETGAPVVLIPGIVGVLHGYYDFAQALGEQRPVYGLHALSLEELDHRHTVESIARLYISSLLEVWDQGPIHILGHSYGGIIGFEMVRQLEEQGYHPGSLILVDADPLALTMKELSPSVFVLRYMLRYLRLDDVATGETAEGLELADSERLATVLRDLVSRRDPDGSLGYDHLGDVQMDQWVRTIQARYIDAYVPPPYRPTAQVLEIWAQHGAMQRSLGAAASRDPSATWHEVLQKPSDRVIMPGDHESVIGREHAPRLARVVNDWIEKRASVLEGNVSGVEGRRTAIRGDGE